ncbi:MAG: GIY-YIG nuclease family protein [Xenococcaceae cyanobacterium]
MSWLYGNEVVQRLGENAFLYDLSKIRGVSAILSRIPDNMSGVYAWYRNYQIDASAIDNPDIFVSRILEELNKPHCVTRETRISPSYKLILKPETIFSQRKQEALKQYANNFFFREFLITLLNNCLLFQQPLYIGKASNLRNRIKNHLRIESVLRERLQDAKHDIEQCRLLILGCSEHIRNSTSENIEIEEDDNSESSQLESEQLIEDILSRLFLPSFTINYG